MDVYPCAMRAAKGTRSSERSARRAAIGCLIVHEMENERVDTFIRPGHDHVGANGQINRLEKRRKYREIQVNERPEQRWGRRGRRRIHAKTNGAARGGGSVFGFD